MTKVASTCLCANCGATIKRNPSQQRANGTYCSRVCLSARLAKLREERMEQYRRDCLHCGKSFIPSMDAMRVGSGTYCGHSCVAKAFAHRIHSPEAVAKSVAVLKAWRKANPQRPEDHPMWRGGKEAAAQRRSAKAGPNRAKEDLVGQRFGRLEVRAFSHIATRRRYWLCACDCGGSITTTTSCLKGGNTRSCGCLAAETTVAITRARMTTHGMSDSPEWRAWSAMKARCNNPRNPKFHLYGGRGIRVCAAWAASFEQFLRDVGPRPTPRHSIERVDGDKGYEVGNVVWATTTEQTRNLSRNVWVRYNGAVMTVTDLAKAIGAPRRVVSAKVKRGDFGPFHVGNRSSALASELAS